MPPQGLKSDSFSQDGIAFSDVELVVGSQSWCGHTWEHADRGQFGPVIGMSLKFFHLDAES